MIAIALLLVFVPFLISLVGGCTVDAETFTTTCGSAIGWIGSIASQIGMAVASAAATLVAAEAYVGIPSDWRRSAAAGLQKIIAIVAATIVVVLVVVAGFVVVLIPGIFLAVSFAVYAQALMIEKVGPMESLGRSWRLASGERWRLFGAGLSMLVISIIALGIIGGILYLVLAELAGLNSGDVQYFVQQVVTLLSIPLSAAFGTVLYLDLRVRKDGLEAAELTALLSRRA